MQSFVLPLSKWKYGKSGWIWKMGVTNKKRRKPHEKIFVIPKFVTNDLVTNLGTYKN